MDDFIWDFDDPYQWMARTAKFPPAIVTVAVNGGIHGRESHAALPERAEDIAAQAEEAYAAGASVIHIHGRDPDNYAECTNDPEVYRDINGRVRERCPGIVINNTTGGGPTTTMEGRIRCLEAMPEMATLNLGPDMERFELAARKPPLDHPREAMVVDMCMPFTYGFVDELAGVMLEKGIKPELEVYQPGQYWVSRGLIAAGLVKLPYLHQFVMGVQTSIFPTPQNVLSMLHELPGDSLFAIAGIGKFQWPLITMAIILGGHVRVGLEDNLYLHRGRRLIGNGEAVEKAVRLVREFGREVATPAQAREMLGLSATPSSY
ncbi:MAG TPA: 3-keto-5-aminohexanoate cleavage protein [Thermoleophilia bacterium]|nr:3-keto-5-aminohexanoate cleavage protein [Thermoleophilia bacterium]